MECLCEVEGKDVEPGLIDGMKFFEAGGCEQCDNIGFKGRVGLYEVLQMSNDLRMSILKGENYIVLEEQAIKAGMTTLEQSGILAALRGQTTLKEVYRVARPMD